MSEIGNIVIYHDKNDRILNQRRMKVVAHDGFDNYKLRLEYGPHEAIVYCRSKDFEEVAK